MIETRLLHTYITGQHHRHADARHLKHLPGPSDLVVGLMAGGEYRPALLPSFFPWMAAIHGGRVYETGGNSDSIFESSRTKDVADEINHETNKYLQRELYTVADLAASGYDRWNTW
jgi:hypothetical protein